MNRLQRIDIDGAFKHYHKFSRHLPINIMEGRLNSGSHRFRFSGIGYGNPPDGTDTRPELDVSVLIGSRSLALVSRCCRLAYRIARQRLWECHTSKDTIVLGSSDMEGTSPSPQITAPVSSRITPSQLLPIVNAPLPSDEHHTTDEHTEITAEPPSPSRSQAIDLAPDDGTSQISIPPLHPAPPSTIAQVDQFPRSVVIPVLKRYAHSVKRIPLPADDTIDRYWHALATENATNEVPESFQKLAQEFSANFTNKVFPDAPPRKKEKEGIFGKGSAFEPSSKAEPPKAAAAKKGRI